ncbi:glycosyltransferase family 4 protein [Rhizosaccharibacter radicis]|uniref:Glycosyltransferase family 4 protein n=1 Tax=Rhizosaccharibacter radicis TaxID=2782605 RepID=A0ABT1VUI4_9PROT|nr:glycosyltransferase family 4 protein [Acetobacteraceae bacterium KSS12]
MATGLDDRDASGGGGAPSANPAPTLWIEVEDLFHYVRHNSRPSGIQRLSVELYAALLAIPAAAGRVRFVRFSGDGIVPADWAEVRALFDGLGADAASGPPRDGSASPDRAGRGGGRKPLARRLAGAVQHRLPPEAAQPFHRFRVLQGAALRSLRDVGRREEKQITAGLVPPAMPPISGPAVSGIAAFGRPGDWLLSLGASWHRTDYGRLLFSARRRGLRTAMLFYDLIPLRRPEWCHHTLVDGFNTWLDGVLPELDAVLSISDFTGADMRALFRERGMPDRPVRTLPLGTGFAVGAAAPGADEPLPDRALPPAGSYVLVVSTIEARKNHLLMFQVWRRLQEELPPDRLPTLVFAGRIGWLVSDLMEQIAATNYLDGRLLIVEDPSDEALIRLYGGCLFTVMPSLFEGWGLPVSESLSLGKPCLVADATALPEAGGPLVRRFDPFVLDDACRAVRALLDDRDELRRWEDQVKRDFRPVSWTETAQTLLAALEEHDRV